MAKRKTRGPVSNEIAFKVTSSADPSLTVLPVPESSSKIEVFSKGVKKDVQSSNVDSDNLEMEDSEMASIESDANGSSQGQDDNESESDFNDMNSVDGDVSGSAAPFAKRARSEPLSSSKSVFKAPTTDEIQQLSQTSELFKSNLFKLQIDELISEVSVSQEKKRPLEKALHKLKSILDSIPSRPSTPAMDAVSQLLEEGISVPFGKDPLPLDVKYKFSFEKPSKVAIVGSFLLKTLARNPSGVNVDMSVQMPDTLFQEKDHVNHRYFHKRAYYLAVIAAELLKQGKGEFNVTIEFEAFQNDLRKPILILTSNKSAGDLHFSKSGFCIRIFPAISATVFPLSKLAPTRNNVRVNSNMASGAAATSQPSTPHYNTLILQDTVLVAHLNFLHHHISESAAFKDACILARVWLTQRGISESQKCGYGISGFLFSMIMGWLLCASGKHSSRRLGNGFSSYQMLKVTIDFIAELDFTKSPLFLTPSGEALVEPEFSSDAYLASFDVAIVDPSGRVNLAAHISRAAMDEIQREARLSSLILKDKLADNFDALLLKKVDRPLLKYDNLIRIPSLTSTPTLYRKSGAYVDFPDPILYAVRYLPKLLKSALTDRTVLITAYAPRFPRWPCILPRPDLSGKGTEMTVALSLHCENSLREVEIGPASDDAKAVAEFRELWGEKAETRRFKDGSITETVVFESDHTLQQRSLIACRMAAHILARHAKILPSDGVTYWAGLGGKYIKAPGMDQTTGSFQLVVDAFQSFMKQVKSLKGLPLSVNTIIPVADALRYSSTFVPQPKPAHSRAQDGYRPYTEPLDVVIEFESSGRWPDELRAIQNMKRAFYIRLGQLIESQNPGTRAVVSIGSNDNLLESGWVDVTHTSGYIFRCRIHHNRERTLLDKALKLFSKTGSPAELSAYTLAQKTYLREFVYLPWHAIHLENLCLRLPFLPVTIRILKRWLSSHLLVSSSSVTSIPEVALELLAAYVYLNPAPFDSPNSGFAGFLRVLDLVQSWDWNDEPLIVGLEPGKIDAELVNDIKGKFKASRLRHKYPSMYIATESDLGSEWWTSQQPSSKILERFIVLARSALAVSIEKFDSSTDNDISQLFSTPLLGYSLIIHLDPSKCSRFRENLTFDAKLMMAGRPKFKNLLSKQDREAALLCEFDPVEGYLQDLETAFSGLALFFHNKYGGDKIAVVWNSSLLQLGSWKTKLQYNASPDVSQLDLPALKGSMSKYNILPNVNAMISEMERLGNGLVLAIERR
ncbi:hypothetical protein BASA61_000874 [Batrachochytrium salamandrivorans]|nr:hypothetical protein BASA61_000874 [Batrachochytrium salamandrivorans]